MTVSSPEFVPRNPPSQATAYRLAALLFGAGTLHLAQPQLFDPLVPAELPGTQRSWTYASGVAELAVAATLVVPKTRRRAGLLAAILFVGVFPGNVNMVRLWWRKPIPYRVGAIARLPLQIPLITQSLKARRNAPVRESITR